VESFFKTKILASIARGIAALISLYQVAISPFKPPSCRFYPSCSEYARQAFEKYGIFASNSKMPSFPSRRLRPCTLVGLRVVISSGMRYANAVREILICVGRTGNILLIRKEYG